MKIQKNWQIISRQTAKSIYWMSDYPLWKGVKSENFGRLPEGKWVKISQKSQILGGGAGLIIRQPFENRWVIIGHFSHES